MRSQELITKYFKDTKNSAEKGNTFRAHVETEDLPSIIEGLYKEEELPLMTIYATHTPKKDHPFVINYVFGVPGEDRYLVPFVIKKDGESFRSFATEYQEFAGYEAEIATMFGVMPDGHPALRQAILHPNWPEGKYPLRKDFMWDTRPAIENKFTHPFVEVEGEGIYQIPVGPVHAGIIEPGHFRFSVLGEEVLHLDAQLGYVHKGTEKLFEHLPQEEHLRLAEHVSGDSSVAHALAYAHAQESLQEITVPKRAQHLRIILAELERLANHFNDIGFIMLDTAFSFGGASGQRLREKVMQLNEKLTGGRYLRNMIAVGGVTKDISDKDLKDLATELEDIKKDFSEVMSIAEESITLANRLNLTGTITKKVAIDHGAIGIPLRAVGVARDARKDHPYDAYKDFEFDIPTEESGDVYARFMVRVREVYESISIIDQVSKVIAKGAIIHAPKEKLPALSTSVGVCEGWRGNIVYIISTDDSGVIDRVKVRDTSFLNWPVVPYAVAGEMVPDFPLVNKSFNLSYSGNDL